MAQTAERLEADRCELCGARVGGARERARHLRSAHPGYARNVVARIAAPLVFVVAVVVLSALHAPPVAFLVALGTSYAAIFFGRIGSRRARTDAGADPTIGVKRTLREGGLRFVLFVPIVVLLVFVLSRMQ
ncbi:MAG TPA: hypothetical protein VFA34_02405 [Actinomycetota bacterium]|jgi:hypothetical protein|nr:hypothetical protein [Actinomycetota bacterium]